MASPRMVLFLFLRQSTCVALFGLIWPYMVFYGRILSFLAVIDSNSFRFCCLIISCISSTFSFQGELLAFFDWVTWPLVWWQPGSLKSSSKRTKMILMPMQLLLKKLCQRNPTRKKPKLYRIKTAAKNPNEKRLESNLSFLQKKNIKRLLSWPLSKNLPFIQNFDWKQEETASAECSRFKALLLKPPFVKKTDRRISPLLLRNCWKRPKNHPIKT